MQILFENDSILAVGKTELIRVQADASGRESLEGRAAEYLAARAAPGGGERPFLGLVHRLDQPVTGVVLFAKTRETLARLGELFQRREVRKVYWAVTDTPPPAENGTLEHYISFNPGKNKAHAFDALRRGAKKAVLRYRLAGSSERYFFLEIELITGRHHQIRAQLAAAGCHVKGDLKYGAARSNPGGGIHLHARMISFTDPAAKEKIVILAPPPEDVLWDLFPGTAGDA